MSSASKKGDKGKVNSSVPVSSKEGTTNLTAKAVTKMVEVKSAEPSKALDQLNPKLQPSAEQLRIAQMISDPKRDDPDLPDKVDKLVELTNCSSDAAVIALHDANNDLDRAISALLDGEPEGNWEVSGKRKKPKPPSLLTGSATGDDGNGVAADGDGSAPGRGRDWNRDRDRSRSSRGGPPRLRGRGRGRDNKENFEDGDGETGGSRGRGSRGGPRMSNGPGREGSGTRGGRGGRGFRRPRPIQSVDTWGEDAAESSTLPKVESWGVDFPSAEDWDNEEYIGSLVETKVFTPSQAVTAVTPVPQETAPLINGSSAPNGSASEAAAAAPSQVLYSTTVSANTSAQQQQVIDLNALLQNTAVSLASSVSAQQQYLHYSQQATDALKAVMGVTSSSNAVKASRPQRAKIPPPSKIPSSAVEMPDDSLVSGLDVKFGTLDFGVEPSGFEIGLDVAPSSTSVNSPIQSEQKQHQQQHGVGMTKMDQYGNSVSTPQPPAPSALPKPDSSLGGFNASVPSAAPSMGTTASQVKSTNSSVSYPYGSGYATSAQSSTSGAAQPAGAYPSSSQPSSGGIYSNSTGTVNTAYQTPSSQTAYGTYAQQQQQQQQQTTYQTYNKMSANSGLSDPSNSVSSLRVDLSSHVTASSASRPPTTITSSAGSVNKPSGTGLAAVSSSIPNLPPGVPTMLGPGGFIMGQAPGLPYYAAAAAGIQQHPVYSLEDMQFRYPHLAAGYYDMGYQSPTSLGTGRDGTLASLAYAGSDAKFPRNENNSPVPTSLSQGAQSHAGAFITPTPAAATALPPAYAYYYSGGVMPGGYQFGAPTALYPVSAAASGHAGSGGASQYGKGGPMGGGGASSAVQSGQTTAGSTGGGPSSGNASYASYGSSYDDFSKSVYGSVGVGSATGQAAKIGGVGATGGPSGAVGAADLGVGPTVYGKSHNQLGKINAYDKAGGFHTGTPPPYGLAGNAAGTPLGVGQVGVSVGVGGPSPYGGQHMFIPTLAAHQSQHSHLMHQQLHQESTSGPGQRSQGGGQQNKPGSKPNYGGSYWGSN